VNKGYKKLNLCNKMQLEAKLKYNSQKNESRQYRHLTKPNNLNKYNGRRLILFHLSSDYIFLP
jgi:hypothetical protein